MRPTEVDAVSERATRAGRQHILDHSEALAAVVAALLLLLIVVGVRAHEFVQLRADRLSHVGSPIELITLSPLPGVQVPHPGS